MTNINNNQSSLTNGLNPSTTYDFRRQLELGELLLDLGRVNEAVVELRKAHQLSEIDSGKHQTEAELHRLETALQKVEGLNQDVTAQTKRVWQLATVALALLLGGLFLVWVFNRADLEKTVAQSTREAGAMFATETAQARIVEIAGMENTRTVQEIINQKNTIATISADNTRIAGIAIARDELATAQAEMQSAEMANDSAAATISALQAEMATSSPNQPNPTTTRRPTNLTSTPTILDWQQLRVLVNGSNLRRGPSTRHRVVSILRRGDIVELLATEPTQKWYNVRTADGAVGWLHTSLVVPAALEEIPMAETVPAPILPQPSATPSPLPTSRPATNTPSAPLPTATVEPLATPTVPPTVTATVLFTATPTVEPTSAIEIGTPVNTPELNGTVITP